MATSKQPYGTVVLGLHAGHDASATVVVGGRIASHILRERISRRRHDFGLSADLIECALTDAGLSIDDIEWTALTGTQSLPLLVNDKRFVTWRPMKEGSVLALRPNGDKWVHHVASPHWQHRKDELLLTRAFEDSTEPDEPFVRAGADWFVESLEIHRRIPRSALVDWQIDSCLSPIYGPQDWGEPTDIAALARAVRQGALCEDLRFGMHHAIEVTIAGRSIPGVFVNHHAAHAASSFFASKGGDTVVFTHDGGTGTDSGFVFRASGNHVHPVAPHFLECGQLYDFVAHRCGMSGMGGAGKLMGLSAYGTRTLFDEKEVGSSADWERWRASLPEDLRFSSTYEALVEAWLRRASELGFERGKVGGNVLDPANVEIASTAQHLVEQTMFRAVMAARDGLAEAGYDVRNLCLSGGVALNCPTNTLLFNEGGFERVFVEPHCDDGGLSAGAAWWLYHNLLDSPFEPAEEITSGAAMLGADHGDVLPSLQAFEGKLAWTVCHDQAVEMARDLAEDKIIAVYQGRSETGPRALGHRSILANPTVAENWARVNRIKGREHWRPFAPVVTTDKFDDYFEAGPNPSPFMLFTHKVREVAQARLPAITHVDGTARVQTVVPADGLMWELLRALELITGIPVVLNTSFNGPGEPIVETPANALLFFTASQDLSAVYIDGYRVEKICG